MKKGIASLPPIVVLPVTTTQEQVDEIRAAGYLPIVTLAPQQVRVILPEDGGSDLLMAALHGLCKSAHSTTERADMVTEFYRRLLAREHPPQIIRANSRDSRAKK
jgi:hypothetical protein